MDNNKKVLKENFEVTFLLKCIKDNHGPTDLVYKDTAKPQSPLDLARSRNPPQVDQQPVVDRPNAV